MHTLSTKLETKPIEKEAGICTWPKTVKTSESPIENHSLLIPKLWLIPVTRSNCNHRKKKTEDMLVALPCIDQILIYSIPHKTLAVLKKRIHKKSKDLDSPV